MSVEETRVGARCRVAVGMFGEVRDGGGNGGGWCLGGGSESKLGVGGGRRDLLVRAGVDV